MNGPQCREPKYDLDHFASRVIQDALNEALASYWVRRSQAFAAAGRIDIATSCMRHASICDFLDFDALYDDVVREVS